MKMNIIESKKKQSSRLCNQVYHIHTTIIILQVNEQFEIIDPKKY